MRTYSLLLLAVPLLTSADAPKKDGGKSETKLWAAISVGQPVFEINETERLQIHFALVNDGDKFVKPGLESSQLLVNGKNLKDWDFIIGQGIQDDRWDALPPGDYLLFSPVLGKYFKEPGVYRVLWKGKGFQSSEIVFRVVPRSGR